MRIPCRTRCLVQGGGCRRNRGAQAGAACPWPRAMSEELLRGASRWYCAAAADWGYAARWVGSAASSALTAIEELLASRMGSRISTNENLSGFDFQRGEARRFPAPSPSLSVPPGGSETPPVYSGVAARGTGPPDCETENSAGPRPWASATDPPKSWIGNQSRVAPHFDEADTHRRRCRRPPTDLLIFPHEQVAKPLYRGRSICSDWRAQPASMVDLAAPDLETTSLQPRPSTCSVSDRTPVQADAMFIRGS